MVTTSVFICQNCGDCCGPIPVSGEELRKILEAINQMSPRERKRLKNQKRDEFACPLRDEEKKQCSVYEARPQVCRLQGRVEGMPCARNPGAPVMSKAAEQAMLESIGPAIGILGLDIGWNELLSVRRTNIEQAGRGK